MKIRIGFVSNSSSSSFIIVQTNSIKDDNVEHNKKLLDKCFGYDNENLEEVIKEYKQSERILAITSIPYDEDIDYIYANVIRQLSNSLDLDIQFRIIEMR